jgi:hypothetical protein
MGCGCQGRADVIADGLSAHPHRALIVVLVTCALLIGLGVAVERIVIRESLHTDDQTR